MPSFAVTAHLPVVGGRSGSDGARFGALREASVFLGADPQHSDDKRVAEAHHDDREHEENDELVDQTNTERMTSWYQANAMRSTSLLKLSSPHAMIVA